MRVMIYSCFDEKTGLYRYFSDSKEVPVNADMPVPLVGAVTAGGVGIPAREAGRKLPKKATRAGSGWHAKGLIVDCGLSTGSFGALPADTTKTFTLLALFGLAAYMSWRLTR